MLDPCRRLHGICVRRAVSLPFFEETDRDRVYDRGMGNETIAMQEDDPVGDERIYSAACERNRQPILSVLQDVLPTRGRVLEIAAGTGMHAAYFAHSLPGLEWIPTDPDPEARRSIDAWRRDAGAPFLQAARTLDTRDEDWGVADVDAILCCNMIHISPWESCRGLFRGADHVLAPEGVVVTYGPYFFPGAPPVPSNEAFDRSLRARDPEWGVRQIDDVTEVARDWGFARERTLALPANNHVVVWRRA